MRDLLVVGLVLYSLPYAFRHPWVGVLCWTWLSIMNPHRLAFGFAQDAPLAAMVAITTLVSMFVTKDKVRIPVGPPTLLLAAFLAWMGVTTVFALHAEQSFSDLKRIFKILLMTVIALGALRTRKQIELFVWVNVLSLGFYGAKGGIFTLAGGGSDRVWGPPDSFIEGNNEVGLALVMIIPLVNYLRLVTRQVWLRSALLVLMLLCAFAVLGTQSRGAFLAIVAMGLVIWLRSQRKVVSAVVIAAAAFMLLSFMPSTWQDRMATIGTYQEDGSAMGRINAWWNAFHLANDRFFGGGFQIYGYDVFARYAPDPTDVHAAHSIYFQILGEHGWLGLLIFVLIGSCGFFNAWRVRQLSRARPDTEWAYHLAGMVQVAMAGYAVGGAFLSLAYFDLPYNILVMVVVTARWMMDGSWQEDKVGAFGASAPSQSGGLAAPPMKGAPS